MTLVHYPAHLRTFKGWLFADLPASAFGAICELFSATKIGYSSRAIFMLFQAMDKIKLLQNSLKMYKIQRRLSRAAGNVSQEELEKIMREVDTSMHNDKGKRKKKRGPGPVILKFDFSERKRIFGGIGVSWERNPLDKSEQRPRKLQL